MRLISRWQNSAGERVRIALNLKGLAYDYVPKRSLGEAEYRRLNPQGLLPTLIVDGRAIAQSGAILEYLEETYPTPPLLPADAVLRAQARAFGAHVNSEMHAITIARVRSKLGELGLGEVGVNHWVTYWMREGFTALEAILASRETAWPFCFGDEPGWADLHLVPQLANARRFGIDLSAYPLLRAVETRCTPRDAFARARPEAQSDYPG